MNHDVYLIYVLAKFYDCSISETHHMMHIHKDKPTSCIYTCKLSSNSLLLFGFLHAVWFKFMQNFGNHLNQVAEFN